MNESVVQPKRVSKPLVLLLVGISLCCGMVILAVCLLLLPLLSDQKNGPAQSSALQGSGLAMLPGGPGSGQRPAPAEKPASPTNPNGLNDEAIQDRVSFLIRQVDKKSPKSMKMGTRCAPELLADELNEVDRVIKQAAEPYGPGAMSARQLRSIILTITNQIDAAADELQGMLDHATRAQGDQIRFHLGVLLAKQHLGPRSDALLEESRRDPNASKPAIAMLVLFDSAANTEIGKPFPPFVFEDLKGKTHSRDDYHGKVLVLNLWTSKSGPCMAELPNLEKLYTRSHGHGLEMLGIDCDRFADSKDPILDRMAWPQVSVNPIWSTAPFGPFGATVTPTMFIVGSDGVLIAQVKTVAGSEQIIDQALSKVTAQATP